MNNNNDDDFDNDYTFRLMQVMFSLLIMMRLIIMMVTMNIAMIMIMTVITITTIMMIIENVIFTSGLDATTSFSWRLARVMTMIQPQ